jgi:L-rhamnose mutarotase
MATTADAELILKMYQLRTEETMRIARDFVGNFNPASFDELLTLHRASGTKENAYWRQVLSYWEMVAAFVLHGVLDPDLFLDTNGESLFLYAKFTPFLEDYAKTFGKPFMSKTAKMIETYPAMQERYTMMLAQKAARQKQANG